MSSPAFSVADAALKRVLDGSAGDAAAAAAALAEALTGVFSTLAAEWREPVAALSDAIRSKNTALVASLGGPSSPGAVTLLSTELRRVLQCMLPAELVEWVAGELMPIEAMSASTATAATTATASATVAALLAGDSRRVIRAKVSDALGTLHKLAVEAATDALGCGEKAAAAAAVLDSAIAAAARCAPSGRSLVDSYASLLSPPTTSSTLEALVRLSEPLAASIPLPPRPGASAASTAGYEEDSDNSEECQL